MMLSENFDEAIILAHKYHRNQTRKAGTVPYIAHLLGVASIVLEYGGDEDQAIAAVLHDAVEDCGGKPVADDIRQRFGDRVADIVEGCTDTLDKPKPPWIDRKKQYLDHIKNATADELLISVADKLYNIRSILNDYHVVGEEVWNRFAGGKDGRLWYARELLKAYQANPNSPTALVNELTRTTEQLESLIASQN